MNETKKCPYCGEQIQMSARKCKWCGEWLDQENQSPQSSLMSCPICGEQIPKDVDVCPFCKEHIGSSMEKQSDIKVKPSHQRSKILGKIHPIYIVISVSVLISLIIGAVKYKEYQYDKEYQETIENSPFNKLQQNLEEAIASGKTLSVFLRDKNNVEALKDFFGEDVYGVMLNLSSYSDEPMTRDPKNNSINGYAWRSPTGKGKTGMLLSLGEILKYKFFYDGLEVSCYGFINGNDNWGRYYYKDDFNEDETDKPYIEQLFRTQENDDYYFVIRLDNVIGIAICLRQFRVFDQLLLRNNDTGEVWELPITLVGSGEAILNREGFEKFLSWLQNASSMKLSAINLDGSYSPYTAILDNEKTRWRESFEQHVMNRQIDRSLFLKTEFE